MSLAGIGGAERIFGDTVTNSFFTVLGVRPAAGRLFADREQHLFKTGSSAADAKQPLLVIGVAGDVSYNSLVDGTRDLFVYLALQQEYTPRTSIVIRSAEGAPLGTQIPAFVASMDPNLPIVSARSLEERIAVGRTPQRIAASLAGGLGLVGLLLSAVGIYGITAYAVAARTREIGIRLALGARVANVVGIVLRSGMSLVAIGGVIGLTIAGAASQLMAALLFGIPPIDPVSFGSTTLLFGAAGLAACYVPVRRATRIDVTTALRYE